MALRFLSLGLVVALTSGGFALLAPSAAEAANPGWFGHAPQGKRPVFRPLRRAAEVQTGRWRPQAGWSNRYPGRTPVRSVGALAAPVIATPAVPSRVANPHARADQAHANGSLVRQSKSLRSGGHQQRSVPQRWGAASGFRPHGKASGPNRTDGRVVDASFTAGAAGSDVPGFRPLPTQRRLTYEEREARRAPVRYAAFGHGHALYNPPAAPFGRMWRSW